MSGEKRQHKRMAVDKSYFAGCKDAPGSANAFNMSVRLLDVSAQGACFVAPNSLRTGLNVQMLIVQPGASTRVSVNGTVRWSTSLESKGRVAHVAGVKFDRYVSFLDGAQGRAAKPTGIPRGGDPRRRSKRFTSKEASIVCLTKEGWVRKLGIRRNEATLLKNLRLTGVQMVSRRKLFPGQRVDMVITLAGDKRPITTEAVVRWCRRDTLSLKPQWEVGCAFYKLDDHFKTSLQAVQLVFNR